MVPLRLSLRNFLCYRGQSELDLTGLRLACLCGDNGNGKSALLDAITWALWGRARGADDELIHMAESETEVDLEFLAGDQRYRVVRRRSRSRRSGVPGQTELVLFQVTAKGLVPLTGDSVRQTEQRVSQLLGLDYSTFINSAFLVQGRADEFTVKPPSQRKQVLADILGLGYYDQAVVRARELAREQEGKRQAVEADLARIEAGLAHLPRYQAEVEAQEAGSEQARARLEVAEARLRELEAVHHRMESLQEQHQEAAQSQGQAAERLAHWQGELAQRQRGLQEHQGLLAQASSIREGYVRWQQAVAEEEALAARLAQALALGQERAALEQAVAAARDKLEGQRREIEGQVALWKPQAQALPGFERQREEVLAWLKALAQEETRQGEQAKLLEAALERQQDLHLHLKQLAAEAQELGEKAKLLAEGGARCPLCGSELALQERERLQAQLSTQGQEKVKERQGLEQERHRLQRAVQALQEEGRRDRQRLSRERASQEGHLQAIEGDISRGRQASERTAQANQQLQALQRRLAGADLLPEEQRRLKELLAQENQLAYDPAQHQAVKEERDRLKVFQELHQRLGEAQGSLETERKALETAQLEVDHWQEACDKAQERRAALEAELADLPRVTRDVQQARLQLEAVAQEHAHLQAELGAARQRLQDCLALQKQREADLDTLRRVVEEKSLYEELAEAFGKRGIQALIIETVLPELEAEANRLLARMSDNRLRVSLETQREARSRRGEPIETLDINISDEWGTRPYELYSGGEAFRINFALRVALSKLLARRAGAPLPSLFLDEGFGTQDAWGREMVVEAIRSIQDDFKLILVITHMEEMKEAFPVRIEVSKTEAGSQITVT